VLAPFKQAEFDITFGRGISREGSLLDVGVELGFIKKSGAWFTYEGEQLGQGRENVKTFLIENPSYGEVDERIREHLANLNAVEADERRPPSPTPWTIWPRRRAHHPQRVTGSGLSHRPQAPGFVTRRDG